MSGVVLSHQIDYFECDTCGYVQTEWPFWLKEAYSRPINASDTGIVARNVANARIVLGSLWHLGSLTGRVVDFAGGCGLLVRLLRDYGVDALWSDRYCSNMLASGFEHTGEKAELITAFEAFEHFLDPERELGEMFKIAPNVLLSTQLIPEPTPQQDAWWYFGKEHGQHIGFFRLSTLEFLARKHGKTLLTNGTSYHLLTDSHANSALWRFITKFNHLAPPLIARKLFPRTQADMILMTNRDK
jgi:hypothetical protein